MKKKYPLKRVLINRIEGYLETLQKDPIPRDAVFILKQIIKTD